MSRLSDSRQAGASQVIDEIEFELRVWDDSRDVGYRGLPERIYAEFAGCGSPMINAMPGDILPLSAEMSSAKR
jgi:hypothetical protein